MEVILLEKVVNLGSLGDKVTVKSGYGRNYLIPQGKAVMATAENLKQFDERRAELEKVAADALTQAKARAEKIAELAEVTVAGHAGEEGRLFGSVTPADIADALTSAGTEVQKAEVKMPEGPIRQTGEYEITLQLHTDVEQTIKVNVVAE